MRISLARLAAHHPPLASSDHPAVPRRGELGAWLAAFGVAAQLVFLPVVTICAAALILLGRLSRWRPHWLLVPGLAGLCWLTGYWRVGFRMTEYWLTPYSLSGAAWRRDPTEQLGLVLHPGALGTALTGAGWWLPVWLLAAIVEAALGLWLIWRRSPPVWRPGLIAALCQWASVQALTAGRTVTRDGCAFGVDMLSGRLAAVRWAAAERGILLACRDEQPLAWPALAVVCAAIRRRKTVLVLDLCANGAAARQVVALAANLCVPAAQVALPAGGSNVGRSVVGGSVVGGSTVGGSTGAGLEPVIGRAIRRREVVAISALPAADVQLGPDVRSAADAQSAGEAQWAGDGRRAGGERSAGDARSAGLAGDARSAGLAGDARSAADAQPAVAALANVLASLRDVALRGDCLVWIAGCEAVDDRTLRTVLGLGPATGTAVLLSTVLLSTVLPDTGLPDTGLQDPVPPNIAQLNRALPNTALPITAPPNTAQLNTALPGGAAAFEWLASAAGLVIVADAVDGRFAVRRTADRAPAIIRSVPYELAAVHLS
jgi:hypothetical protein